MSRFMEIKSINPKLTQKQIAKDLGFSDCTIKRYRTDISMNSPYRLPFKRSPSGSQREPERPHIQ